MIYFVKSKSISSIVLSWNVFMRATHKKMYHVIFLFLPKATKQKKKRKKSESFAKYINDDFRQYKSPLTERKSHKFNKHRVFLAKFSWPFFFFGFLLENNVFAFECLQYLQYIRLWQTKAETKKKIKKRFERV